MKRRTVAKILVCVFAAAMVICNLPATSVSAETSIPLSGISDRSVWKFTRVESAEQLKWLGLDKLLTDDASWNRDEWAVMICYGTPFKDSSYKSKYPQAYKYQSSGTYVDYYKVEDYAANGDLDYISGSTINSNDGTFVGSNLDGSVYSYEFDPTSIGVQFMTTAEGLPVLEYVGENKSKGGLEFNIRLRDGDTVTDKYLSMSSDTKLSVGTNKGKICISFESDNSSLYEGSKCYDDTAAKLIAIPQKSSSYYHYITTKANTDGRLSVGYYNARLVTTTNSNFYIWIGHKTEDIGYTLTDGTYLVRSGETFYSGVHTVIGAGAKLIIDENGTFVVDGEMYVAGTIELRGGTLIIEELEALYNEYGGSYGKILGCATSVSGSKTNSNIIVKPKGLLQITLKSRTSKGDGYISLNGSTLSCAGTLKLCYSNGSVSCRDMLVLTKSYVKIESGGSFYTRNLETSDEGDGADAITYLTEPSRYVNIDKNVSRAGKEESRKVLGA